MKYLQVRRYASEFFRQRLRGSNHRCTRRVWPGIKMNTVNRLLAAISADSAQYSFWSFSDVHPLSKILKSTHFHILSRQLSGQEIISVYGYPFTSHFTLFICQAVYIMDYQMSGQVFCQFRIKPGDSRKQKFVKA